MPGFSLWGGSIAFDTSLPWYFGTDTSGLAGNVTDFAALAEIDPAPHHAAQQSRARGARRKARPAHDPDAKTRLGWARSG